MHHVYITLAGENKTAIYTMDESTGELDFQQDVPLSGGPGPFALSPDKAHAYVGIRSTNELSSFRVDRAAGGLTLIDTIDLESDPCYIGTDKNGRYILSAYYAAGRVAVHPIGPDGAAETPPIEWRATLPKAHCVHTDATNRFTFLPHVGESNAIFQFRFDETTGRLTANDPPQVHPPDGDGPRHYAYHPNGRFAYFDNEQGCSVTAYALDPEAGTLAPFQTLSTLPDDFEGENSCAQIHITPSGDYLYASNRGHNSIAMYAVDPDTGELTSLGQQSSVPIPRAFNIDPTGAYLLATSLQTGDLATYRIDPTGRLNHVHTQHAGRQPMWVEIVDLS